MANTYELIVKTVDQSSRPLRNIERSLATLESRANTVRNSLRTVGAAAIAFATGGVARGIINQYTQFERYRTVLSTFLGSQQAANRELQRLQVLANSLPQDLQDITEAFVILNRFGIDTSSEALTAFSNIATANSKSFTQLGEAVADALTGEFERLKEFGIRVSRENDQFVARIGEDQVALAGTTEDLVRQLQALGEEGGRFSGAAEANASTLGQAFSNLQGAIFETSVAIGEELRPALIEVTNLTTQLLRDNQELARTIGAGTGEAIRTLARAVQLLAANFDLITDVALTLIFVRIASSVATLVGSLARATAAAKTLGGVTSGIGKVFAVAGAGAANLIGRLTGLSTVIRLIAGLTPIGRVITIGITGAIAAITFLRDKTFQVGETTTSLSEIARAVFNKIPRYAEYAGQFISDAFTSVRDYVRDLFETYMTADVRSAFTNVMSVAKRAINFVLNLFVAIGTTVAEVFRNIPALASGAFNLIVNQAARWYYEFAAYFKDIEALFARLINFMVTKFAEFVNMTGNVFNQAADLLGLDFEVDTFGILSWASSFEGAIIRAENAASGFRDQAAIYAEAASRSFEDVDFSVDYSEIFATDRLAQFTESIGSYFGRIGGNIERLVLDYREFQAAQEEAAAAAAAAATVYDDAILRQARGLGVLNQAATESVGAVNATTKAYNDLLADVNEQIAKQQLNAEVVRLVNAAYRDGVINIDQYRLAMQGLGVTIAQTGSQLSGFQQFLNQTIETARSTVTQQGYAQQAFGALEEQLASGQLSTDAYAVAVQNLNSILGITTETAAGSGGGGGGGVAQAIETVTSTYERGIQALADYELKSRNVTGAMQLLERDFANGSITLDQFGIAMQGMGANMDDIQNRSIALGLTLTESFEKAGDGLARGLARGIARGEGVMQSFKNFMQSILEEILYQIIQQAFIKPLISSMTSGLSAAFGAFGRGGVGAFGGGGLGLLGGLFGGGGGLFGILGSFLGFANGGVVPGLPTAGDSVPILATPGEVILNKQQQAEVMQGGTGEPITVNFNINAIDTQSGTEFILQNKKQITSVIQQAYNTRGRQGPLG